VADGDTGPPLALTMGEPSGIGPDITLQAWLARNDTAIPPFAVLGDPALFHARARALSLDVPIREVAGLADAPAQFARALPVYSITSLQACEAGRPSSENAGSVIAAIEGAVAAVHRGAASAVVTNPIAKSVLYDAGFRFPGHTEFLASLCPPGPSGGAQPQPVMMIVSGGLRVVPATIHIPLHRVPGALSQALIERTARIVIRALMNDFAVAEPRLAITGLNPHAGEGGALGSEEIDVIAPAIARLRGAGLEVTGPHPADTLFHRAARAGYDAVLAMYHDQALIPLKTLAFETGVNVTLGLDIVRTSPDHGTAFDLAGKGGASPDSLIAALKLGSEIAARRSSATRP